MPDDEKSGSRLPVRFDPLSPTYKRPERKNALVSSENYDKIDEAISSAVKLGSDGVAYVSDDAFPALFDVSPKKAAYIFQNQIPDMDKREDGENNYAHSSAVVGLLDKKSQEVRNADTQAKLQYSRDSLIAASDSDQAQNLRRQCDTFTRRELPKLRQARGGCEDELTGEPLVPGAAFHHVNPRELHTDPQDALDPGKGRILNRVTHTEVHQKNLYDEQMFEDYKQTR